MDSVSYPTFDDTPAWGATDPASTGDIIQDAIKKDKLVKYALSNVEIFRK